MAQAPEPGTRPAMPSYELSSYEPVTITVPRVEVDDAVVERRIKEMVDRLGGEWVPTAATSFGPKDHIRIDMEISCDGEAVPGYHREDVLYSVSSANMPIEFDRKLFQMKVGETQEFDFESLDFTNHNKGRKTFHARVTVKCVVEKKPGVLNEAWVKMHMPKCGNVPGLYKHVREQFASRAAAKDEHERLQRAATELATRFSGAIDDYWYEKTRASIMKGYEQQAAQQGITVEELIKRSGMERQQFDMMLMLDVRKMLQERFSLDAWARHYGLAATEDDIIEFANRMAPNAAGAELVARIREDAEKYAEFEQAALRFVANRDLVSKATILFEE